MKLWGKIFIWYSLIIFVTIAASVSGGYYLYNAFVDEVESGSTIFLISYLPILFTVPVLFIAGLFLLNKILNPLFALRQVVAEAEHLPPSSGFPELKSDDTGPIASDVRSIYKFMNQRHCKLQQILHFSSLTSHELRTPLSIIRNQLEDGLQSNVKLKYLNEIVASTYDEIIRLHHLVNDLLTISTIHAGTLKFEKKEIEFHTFIKDIYDEVILLSREKDISVVLARGPQVSIKCDPIRLRQVLFNLIENALKFTPEKGRIHITYRTINSSLQFKISDTGQGMSQEQIKRIFEPFYQVKYDQRSHVGAGLGLTLVRWIVEAHKGTIGVESEEGKGTTFIVTIPR